MIIYLVRHGETDSNKKEIVQGQIDTKLNETGLKQAADASSIFTKDIEAIFSSDLSRAKQTADAFANKFPELPFTLDKRLRERNFGELQGKPNGSLKWKDRWESNDPIQLKGAEQTTEWEARAREFINFLKTSDYQKILVVTHGGTINVILRIIDGESYEYQKYSNLKVLKREI